MKPTRIVTAGDGALLVEFENRIDPDVNAHAVGLASRLRDRAAPGVYDVVPAFRTVTIYFDPLQTDVGALVAGIHASVAEPGEIVTAPDADVEIPVCYDPEFGLDLPTVARHGGLSVDEVIAIHTMSRYRVYMLGFMPGFAYLGTVDPRIAAPRLVTPRITVPAGSVGIAGQQTGVYPTATPGGWNIVGRTPLPMLTPDAPMPSLLAPGQHVRFRAIDRRTFDAWPLGQVPR